MNITDADKVKIEVGDDVCLWFEIGSKDSYREKSVHCHGTIGHMKDSKAGTPDKIAVLQGSHIYQNIAQFKYFTDRPNRFYFHHTYYQPRCQQPDVPFHDINALIKESTPSPFANFSDIYKLTIDL